MTIVNENAPVLVIESLTSVPAGGDVSGPGSSTDGTVAVFDGDTGKLLKEPDGPISCAGQDLVNVGADQTAFNPAYMSSVGASIGQIPIAIADDAVEWGDAASGAVPEVRTLYVGKHGADSNDGTSIGVAKLTMAAAVAAAAALTPTQGAPVVIRVVDAGIYSESLTLPDWVSLDAPNATVQSPSGDAVSAGNGCRVRLKQITQGRTNQHGAVMSSGATGACIFDVDTILSTGFGNVSSNKSTVGRMSLRCKDVYSSYRGIASSNVQDLYINIDNIIITASNAVGIFHADGGIVRGRFGSIRKESPGLTGTIGIAGGIMSLIGAEIDCDTAWDIPFGNTMDIVVAKVVGIRNEGGTVNRLVAAEEQPKINDVTETAGATYSSNEQNMLNNLKARQIAIIDAMEVFGLTST